ncbi:MAG: twin-arginine translocase subunit TatC [Acidimicrobiia bacterium]
MARRRKKRDPDAQMSVIEHLGELRRRLIISMIAIAVGAVVVFMIFNWLMGFLVGPYHDITDQDLIFTGTGEAFATRLKVATYGGFVLASPVVLWQVWRFVTPALNPKEKRYAIPFIVASLLFFALGAVVAWITFPRALDFLLGIGGDELEPFIAAGSYVSLVTLMMVAFGVAFEFPVLIVFLLMARVISVAQLTRWRRYVIVGVVAFAAVITPSQDPYSLLLMAVPMWVFYEVAILIGRIMKR